MSKLEEFLRELERSGFYGSVELKYEGGHLVLARKSETIKLSSREDQNYRNNRGLDVQVKK